MNNKRKIIWLTIFAWVLITMSYAYIYVTTILSHPGLEGYEAEWNWQLFFFGIVRLPWLIVGLVIIILLENKLIKNKDNS